MNNNIVCDSDYDVDKLLNNFTSTDRLPFYFYKTFTKTITHVMILIYYYVM